MELLGAFIFVILAQLAAIVGLTNLGTAAGGTTLATLFGLDAANVI